MKQFHNETNFSNPEIITAEILMDVVPKAMHYIRSQMRRYRASGLSVQEFRSLIFLYRHENATLSQIAEHIGIKLPSMSKIIDSLAERKLLTRDHSVEDRRRIRLKLSPGGLSELSHTREKAIAGLSKLLSGLTPEQQSGIASALNSIKPIFESINKMEKTDNAADNKKSMRSENEYQRR